MNDGITSPSYDDEVELLASKGVYQIIGSQDSFSNQMVFFETAYNFQGSYNLGARPVLALICLIIIVVLVSKLNFSK